MNKKYFAKYLPIEGEIKEGDYFIEKDTLGNDNILPCLGLLSLVPHDHLVSRKKVKLFLCSRDIQVGDKVYTGSSIFELDYNSFCALRTLDSDKKWFKIIGEISPEAEWVKEGDKFDKADLSAHGAGPNWNDSYGKYKFIVRCKCCNTFK
jgi:hypothetical protein